MSLARSHGPRSMPDRDERAGGRDEAGAVPPGEPHLLAAGVEGDGQAGHHPVARADGLVLQEHPRLGVDERGGAAVADGDALRRAGGARGEDDPGVVRGVGGRPRTPAASASGSVERMTRSVVTTAATPASLKTSRARSSGSSRSTGT